METSNSQFRYLRSPAYRYCPGFLTSQ